MAEKKPMNQEILDNPRFKGMGFYAACEILRLEKEIRNHLNQIADFHEQIKGWKQEVASKDKRIKELEARVKGQFKSEAWIPAEIHEETMEENAALRKERDEWKSETERWKIDVRRAWEQQDDLNEKNELLKDDLSTGKFIFKVLERRIGRAIGWMDAEDYKTARRILEGGD